MDACTDALRAWKNGSNLTHISFVRQSRNIPVLLVDAPQGSRRDPQTTAM